MLAELWVATSAEWLAETMVVQWVVKLVEMKVEMMAFEMVAW